MGNDNLVGELVSDYEVVGAVNDFPIGEYSDGNESEYFESDDMGSYCSEVDSDDESEFVRRKNPRVRFDTKTELPVFCIGMIFSSMDEARRAVKKYAIKRGLGIKLVKNDKTRLRAKCKEGCPWKILISMERNDETLIVKTYEHKHECQIVEKVRFANYKYLVVQLKEHVYNQPGITLKALTTICQKEIKLHVSFSVVAKARQIILTEMIGDYQREYALLHDYVRIIITSNPGSTCIVKSSMDEGSDRPTFTKFYVCFEACKKGWLEGCRKIVGLDGCFMKGLCKGQLLYAIGRDGNNQMFPIAWAVVQVENTTTWTWFIRCLQRDIQLGDGEGITIMSDMQKVTCSSGLLDFQINVIGLFLFLTCKL
ncbi:hypothetical protein Sjap_000490 [Stephania japonica]|uniref:Transposase MuDR plant domain-containing protein n=1 Tax=Stephania japonica TaxID=461633 RepID=A0AAP0PSH6_9MAGN